MRVRAREIGEKKKIKGTAPQTKPDDRGTERERDG